MALRMKVGDLERPKELKKEGGVRVKCFKDFYLDGDISYSLEEVICFSRDRGRMLEGLQEFLNHRMRGEDSDLNEVILIGMAVGEEVPYSHAVAILATENDSNLLISDS
jgi:hypothetical protein